MSLLERPWVARFAARLIQATGGAMSKPSAEVRFLDVPARTRQLLVPTGLGDIATTVYEPPENVTNPAVYLNFHGSGYVIPGRDMDDGICRYLAHHAGVVVVNVEYGVAPQAPFPTAPRQGFALAQWVVAHAAEQGWDGTRLLVGGQSAGGAIATAVARQARDAGGPDILLQVLNYPPLDLVTPGTAKRARTRTPFLKPWMSYVFDNAYVPDPAQRADPLVSPAHTANLGDVAGLPPAVVLTAELDLLRDEADRFAQALSDAGVPTVHEVVPGVDHAYTHRGPRHQTTRVLDLVVEQITQVLARKPR
jgi:acetyl esterase